MFYLLSFQFNNLEIILEMHVLWLLGLDDVFGTKGDS